jgi:hypothetical protein
LFDLYKVDQSKRVSAPSNHRERSLDIDCRIWADDHADRAVPHECAQCLKNWLMG